MVVSAAGLLAVLLVAVGVACQTDPSIAMNALVIPFTPLFWESLSEALRHLDSARTKEDLQQQILALWRVALGRPVSESKVRDIQNEIVHLRRSNAQVPDWFDNRLRDDNEKAMRVSAADMVAEAARHGKT